MLSSATALPSTPQLSSARLMAEPAGLPTAERGFLTRVTLSIGRVHHDGTTRVIPT